MEIIPVIDLMHGNVVHARLGLRQLYSPIQSTLCKSSAPSAIVDALIELYPFKRLYIADLDAINGLGHHLDTIMQIQDHYPDLEIWLDAGISNIEGLSTWQSINLTHVIGSENITTATDFVAIGRNLAGNFVLSLDFNQKGFLGCPELENQTRYWPDKVIVMDLKQVGSEQGPAAQRLESIKKQAGNKKIFAAGGIRNNADLVQLATLSISGALVATALHNGNLSPI
jgi:phosphoribosylformimino-5-aminoimidazole carboxamide ribotide isomerase